MSEVFNLANQQFKSNNFEEAIINYKSVLQNSKSNDEKYIACLRIHESIHQIGAEEQGIYYLIESHKYDNKRIECIYKLIAYYNIKGSPNISLLFYSLIQDYFENECINDYMNFSKKLDVKIDEYTFYLPYFMIIIAHKLNKPNIAKNMFKIIFKFKYIDSGEWWLNNLFHNFYLFIDKIDIKENLFREFEIYLNLIYVHKKYNLNLQKINEICNYGIKFGLNYRNIKYLNKKHLKILFHMSDNRPIKNNCKIDNASYNGLAAVINYEYCKKYGYHFKYYVPYLNQLEPLSLYNCLDPNNDQPRHASWSKLLASQKALDSEENYDYIVYLDSDCIVKNFDIPLESIIYGNENKNMILFWDRPCTQNEPNAGVYICKNNFNTKLMIEKWYNVNIPYQNINRIWEQSALWKVYKGWQALDPDNLVILENINMVEKENQYLRHITTGESHNRISYFRDIIERKKINYTENLENIIEEQFDTNLLYSKKIKFNNNQEECNKSNKILFYTGFCDKKWNYTYSINNALGGSERAVINIAKYLQKDYDIYISGDVEEETFESIKFVNEENLSKLLKENYFKSIIVSRFINFFELYPFFKTKNLFIWGHDTNLLSRSLDSQKTLNILNKWNSNINNYICLTEWQKQRYENIYPMIKGKINLINNGINLDLFPKNINKKRNRFVFTSGPGRGLGKVLELWPEICNKLEDAELKFATYTNFPSNEEDNKMQEIISKYKNIQFMGKLNPSELYELQASSEYWLYPTNFDETSCITALEMLYNEVICVYYPRAGLVDTVGEYGIKVSNGNEIDSIINLTEEDKIRIRTSGKKYAEECSWENRAIVWNELNK